MLRMTTMISGFMIVKDVLEQGYPFAEAVASALPVCDEFLISEGYSTDGTFEIVQRMSNLNRKIKIFRQHWPRARKMAVLAELTNQVRKRCKFNYIFSVQANEIVHEGSVKLIRALPEMCPETQTFSFPYLHLMWNYRISQEFKSSFSRNLPGVASIGDAWALGPTRAFVISEAFKSLKNPRQFLSVYLGRGSLVYSANRFSKPIYLPQPIFRYWSLFPRSCLAKCAKHAEMFNLTQFSEHVKTLERYVDDPSSFWPRALNTAKAGIFSAGINYPEALRFVKKEEHPRLVQGLISTSNSSYHVREEILDAIKEI